ncbi:hypothetical protein PLICRDRAFT_178514 [Plicaturopsis crispa FD-325 SS-3]|nr:hypothetical protein PLICRDRAFT_178514 [Plicaturopsis crispa FD-325 SS-3]
MKHSIRKAQVSLVTALYASACVYSACIPGIAASDTAVAAHAMASTPTAIERPANDILKPRAIAHANIAADHSLEIYEQDPCPNKGKLSPPSASCTRVPTSDGRGANTEILATTLGQSAARTNRPSYPAPSPTSMPYSPTLAFTGHCEDGECIAPLSAVVFVVAFVFAAVWRYAVLASKWIFRFALRLQGRMKATEAPRDLESICPAATPKPFLVDASASYGRASSAIKPLQRVLGSAHTGTGGFAPKVGQSGCATH